MTIRYTLITVLLLLCSLSALADTQDAVVLILSEGSSTHDGLGSGFFFTSDGRILTCYHVIEGAKRLIILDGRGWYGSDDITVVSIAPEYDLAVLQVRNAVQPVPVIPISTASPAEFAHATLQAYGHPVVLGETPKSSRIETQAITDSFRPSSAIRSPDTHIALFRSNIDIIPLAMPAIYRGDSRSR